jgi:serine/threonine protein kinase
MTSSLQDRQTFFQEAAVLNKLAHNNIIRCLGVVVDAHNSMIVLDYISDGEMQSFLQNNKLPMPKLIRICQDLSSAVAYLESSDIIHGSISRCDSPFLFFDMTFSSIEPPWTCLSSLLSTWESFLLTRACLNLSPTFCFVAVTCS